MMEVRRCRWLSKLLSGMEESRSSKANAWRIVSNTTRTNRETEADHNNAMPTAYITTLNKLGFEQEKGQRREWGAR
jgi:hypothetical protein